MKEFSIIVCSRDDEKFRNMVLCYESALAGESYEVVRVNDARSMCEGFQRGFNQSTGRYVVFTHDDAAPLRRVGARLRSHLRSVEIVGAAGTDRLIGPQWFTAGPPFTFGQVLNKHPQNGTFLLSVFGVPAPLVTGIQAIDGFFMACRREVVGPGKAWFDAKTFDDFHFYDLDFSFGAWLKGYKIGVATDLTMLHASTGGYNEAWKSQIPRFMDKYGKKLHVESGQRQICFTSVVTPDMNEAVALMDGFVERAA